MQVIVKTVKDMKILPAKEGTCPYCAEHEPENWFDEESYLEDLEESEE